MNNSFDRTNPIESDLFTVEVVVAEDPRDGKWLPHLWKFVTLEDLLKRCDTEEKGCPPLPLVPKRYIEEGTGTYEQENRRS